MKDLLARKSNNFDLFKKFIDVFENLQMTVSE